MQTKTKKNVGYKIAISALVLLLTIAMILTATGAWFQDKSTGHETFEMGDPVLIAIQEDGTNLVGGGFSYNFNYAMPGDELTDAITVDVSKTTSPMYVRAKLIFKVTKLMINGTLDEDVTTADIEGEITRLNDLNGANLLAAYPGKVEADATAARDADVACLTALKTWSYELTAENGWSTPSDLGYSYYNTVVTGGTGVPDLTIAPAVEVPENWTNVMNNAVITLDVTVEAMQAANITAANDTNPWKEDIAKMLTNAEPAGTVEVYANVDRTPAGDPED